MPSAQRASTLSICHWWSESSTHPPALFSRYEKRCSRKQTAPFTVQSCLVPQNRASEPRFGKISGIHTEYAVAALNAYDMITWRPTGRSSLPWADAAVRKNQAGGFIRNRPGVIWGNKTPPYCTVSNSALRSNRATVNHQLGTRDIGRFVRSQKQQRVSCLINTAGSSQRDCFNHFCTQFWIGR